MMAVLIAVRDALIVLALSWVGVTLERNAPKRQRPNRPPAASPRGCCKLPRSELLQPLLPGRPLNAGRSAIRAERARIA